MVLLRGKENEENIYTSECGINISPPIPSLLPYPKPTRQLTQRIKTLQTPTFGIIINFWVINTWNYEKKIILPFMGQMSHAKILGYKSWPCYKFSSSSPDSPQICSVRLSSPSAALIGDNPLTEIAPPSPNSPHSPLLVTTNGSMSKLWHDTHHQFKANRISENRYPYKLFAQW